LDVRIQAIPFLLELRSVLDWVCTKTTLTLNHWLKMEDIYANIFIMKCWRDSEKVRNFLLNLISSVFIFLEMLIQTNSQESNSCRKRVFIVVIKYIW